MIRLTTDHAASCHGIPVFVGDDGQLLDYAAGLRALRRERQWSTAQLASLCGVSRRTIENWEQGRPPGGPSMRLLQMSL